MKFRNIDIEVSGINEVIIEDERYSRVEHKQTTNGGRVVVNKYFKRNSDGHMIHEHNFMRKLKRLQGESQIQHYEYTYVDEFGGVKTEHNGTRCIKKWRFWISGDTINVVRILI